jgi:hypothetical protein
MVSIDALSIRSFEMAIPVATSGPRKGPELKVSTAMLSPRISSTMRSANQLAEAGLTAYQMALKERLPLAHIAEQSERPQYWFANNMLQVVGVYGTLPGVEDFLHLTRKDTGGLTLIDNMTALISPETEAPRYEDLRIPSTDFEKYMEWARTVY